VLNLIAHADGTILSVRAQPGARKTGVLGEQAGSLKLAVTAPPADGKANKALVELLREVLRLKRSQVELTAGATSRQKRYLIRGMNAEEVNERVAKFLNRES
jgi:uncharacterized protein